MPIEHDCEMFSFFVFIKKGLLSEVEKRKKIIVRFSNSLRFPDKILDL